MQVEKQNITKLFTLQSKTVKAFQCLNCILSLVLFALGWTDPPKKHTVGLRREREQTFIEDLAHDMLAYYIQTLWFSSEEKPSVPPHQGQPPIRQQIIAFNICFGTYSTLNFLEDQDLAKAKLLFQRKSKGQRWFFLCIPTKAPILQHYIIELLFTEVFMSKPLTNFLRYLGNQA